MQTELRIISNTSSPSGRYALAWGIPGVPILERVPFDDYYRKVRNYVIEKRTKRILGTVPLHTRSSRWYNGQTEPYKEGGVYWEKWHESSQSNSGMSVVWNRAEDRIIILHNGKWWYNAIYYGERQQGHWNFIEIGDEAEDIMRSYVRRRKPQAFAALNRADGREPYVAADSAKIVNFRVVLELHTDDVAADKEDRTSPLRSNAEVTFRIVHPGGRLTAQFEHLKPLPNN